MFNYVPVESAATPPPPLAPPPTPQTSYQIIDPQVQSMDVQYWNNYTLASAPTTPTYVMSPHVLWSKGQFFLYASVERHVLGGSVWIDSTERKNEVKSLQIEKERSRYQWPSALLKARNQVGCCHRGNTRLKREELIYRPFHFVIEGTVVCPMKTNVQESCNTILKIYCCQGQLGGNWKLLAKRPTLYSINISKHLML